MAEQTLIEQLALQVRGTRAWTDKLLARAPDDWLYRRVDWTDNTIAWHMAHLAWEQDTDAPALFGVAKTLDADWERLFGFDCAVHPPDAYPPAARVRTVFDDCQARFLSQLEQLDDAALSRPLDPAGSTSRESWTVLNGIVNILVHEGEHSDAIGILVGCFEDEVGKIGEGGEIGEIGENGER